MLAAGRAGTTLYHPFTNVVVPLETRFTMQRELAPKAMARARAETGEVMRNITTAGAAALFMSLFTASQALADDAFCNWTGTCGGGGSTPAAVPEFDGPGAIAVVALLVSVVAIIYQRARK